MTNEEIHCSSCLQGASDGLELMPSGKNFKRHKDGDGQPCTDGKIEQPTPKKAATPAPKSDGTGECVECGERYPVLKSGKLRKHAHPKTGNTCAQEPGVEVKCPQGNHRVRLSRGGKLPVHKDPELGARCIGSNKTPEEAAAATVAVKPTGKITPPRPKDPYRALTPIQKSETKAKRLAAELKELGWRSQIKLNHTIAELTLRRGKNGDTEEMFITWDAGACVGGDGMITHEYKGRKIAVRNANAVRARAATPAEQIAAEYARVANRKVGRPTKGGTKAKTKATPVMPFDPETASDDEIVQALTNKKVVWENKLAGKQEEARVRNAKIQPSKNGRNIALNTEYGQRVIKATALVSVA